MRLESHKSDLEKINISHQIRFSSLHAERAVIIKSLYHSLYEYKIAILDFFENGLDMSNPEYDLDLKIRNWSNSVVNFSSLFQKNRIFFSKPQAELIDSLNNEMEKINHETKVFLNKFEWIDQQVNAIMVKSADFERFKNSSLINLEKARELEESLEFEFRILLGVDIK